MELIEQYIKNLGNHKATTAIFLGSGFDDSIKLENPQTVLYKDIGFEYREVKGHKRALVFGKLNGHDVVLASRFHLYESGNVQNLFLLYQLLKHIGVKTVIATTAVGAINEQLSPGDLMIIKDHINLSGTNPLIGVHPIEFVDLTNAYDDGLRDKFKKIAKKKGLQLFEGVHLQTMGPTYETPAEVKFYRTIGVDTVSMSMAFGCMCANFLKMRFVAFAGIANKAVVEDGKPLTHDEVLRGMKNISKNFSTLIYDFFEKKKKKK